MEILLFSLIFTQKLFLTKELTLKTNSAASSGGQGKLTYLLRFPWLPLEVTLSVSTFCSLFTRAWKILLLVYTCLEDFVSCLHVLGRFFLVYTCLKYFLLVYTCLEDFVSCLHVLERFSSCLHVLGRFCFLFTRACKSLFLVYTLLMTCWPPKGITQHQASVSTMLNAY
jgi:hypothetical protein